MPGSRSVTREVLGGGRVRGGIVLAHLEWVDVYHGPKALQELMRKLPLPLALEIGSLRTGSWCSFESLITLDKAMEQVFDRGGPDFHRELGRYSAHRYLSMTDPALDRDNIEEFFRNYAPIHSEFQDFGRVEFGSLGEGAVRMIHSGYPCFSPLFCQSALGFYEQVIVMHGGRSPEVVESDCQCRGDRSCTFTLRWV